MEPGYIVYMMFGVEAVVERGSELGFRVGWGFRGLHNLKYLRSLSSVRALSGGDWIGVVG